MQKVFLPSIALTLKLRMRVLLHLAAAGKPQFSQSFSYSKDLGRYSKENIAFLEGFSKHILLYILALYIHQELINSDANTKLKALTEEEFVVLFEDKPLGLTLKSEEQV